MKIKSLIAALVAVLMFTSCGALKNATSGNTDYNNGSKAGTVLLSLATQYLTTGKIDLTSAQNILNIVSLTNSLSSLKSESNQATVDFGNGLMSSNSNVTQSNLSSVLSGLTAISNLNTDSVANSLQKGTQTSETTSLLSQLSGVLNLLK